MLQSAAASTNAHANNNLITKLIAVLDEDLTSQTKGFIVEIAATLWIGGVNIISRTVQHVSK